MTEFETETGCRVMVIPHRDIENNRLTGNTLLVLRMADPEDGRYAELMLQPDEKLRLGRMLLGPTSPREHLCWDGIVKDGSREGCCDEQWKNGEDFVEKIMEERA